MPENGETRKYHGQVLAHEPFIGKGGRLVLPPHEKTVSFGEDGVAEHDLDDETIDHCLTAPGFMLFDKGTVDETVSEHKHYKGGRREK